MTVTQLPRRCHRCLVELTDDNTKRYWPGGGGPAHAEYCDLHEWEYRDDLAWLTGTGRWGQ